MYQGCWIEENGNNAILCEIKRGKLKCTWPSQFVEKFQIEATTLTGDSNQMIYGWIDKETITWNTGNHWLKKGSRKIFIS